MFNKSKTQEAPCFRTRSEAFDYLFTSLVQDNVDMEVAAQRANAFADIVAKNKGLPDLPEKPKTAIEKGVGYLQQVLVIKKDHPEIWELVAGLAGGAIGAIAGVKSAEQPAALPEPLDFDNME